MTQKEVIPTWKTFYTVNTGSHDHCVYVYNDHRVSHDQFITMASLYYLYTFSHCAITCTNLASYHLTEFKIKYKDKWLKSVWSFYDV